MANSLVHSEESSWTSYIQDFMATQETEDTAPGSSFSIHGGSSMVPDAASCVEWNPPSHRGCKKLSCKRRKAIAAMDDDDDDDALEDTATSPVNSPKVSLSNHQVDMSSGKEEDTRKNSQNGVGFVNSGEVKRSKVAEMNLSEGIYDCTELRKRGLCLVPLSMLTHYLS